MATDAISYDKSQLRSITRAFKAMDDEATSQAKGVSNGLATYLQSKIVTTASGMRNRAALRIAQGAVVSKSSKIGDISFGFARQKFSGGGTTQINLGKVKGGIGVLGGYEFGSNVYKQFPVWSGSGARGGSKGWFIYPTLRAEQPYIVSQWEKGFDQILKEW